jgi:ApeA N-terminal domain 1
VTPKVIEETGYFWWGDTPVPPPQLVPESAVVGKLTLDDDGRAHLELEGVMPNKLGPWAALGSSGAPLPDGKAIHGILKGSNKAVRLLKLQHAGGSFKTNGISYERYSAAHCLLGEGPFQDLPQPMVFHRFTVELKGFEEWLWLRGITAERSESTLTASYSVPDKVIFPLEDGELHIVYGVRGPYLGTHRGSNLTLTEFVDVVFIPHQPLSLADMQAQFMLLADLLILLTGSDFNPDWPELSLGEGEQAERFQFYFTRLVSRDKELPGPHQWWVNFPRIEKKFGEVFTLWRRRREEWGPGVYLYLGTRRSVSMYEEHRFIMLTWGLESLHRRRAVPARGEDKLQQKIERVLAQVQEAKDKRWLERLLEHAGEPSLEQRIFETLEPLPLDLDKDKLRAFAKECADRRNEISHFGGRRLEGKYDNEIEDLHKKSEALSNLYHLLLLREIGIDDESLRAIAQRSLRAFQIKFSFVEVGLLPPSALKDPRTEAATAAARAAAAPQVEPGKECSSMTPSAGGLDGGDPHPG